MGELETEAEKSRGEIATYLRVLADQLDADGDVTLELGGRQVRSNPVTFEPDGQSEWSESDPRATRSTGSVRWRDAQTPAEGPGTGGR